MRNTTVLLAVVAVLAMAVPAWGSNWNVAGPASWDIASNWDSGVPTSTDNAVISNGGICEIQSGTNAVADSFWIDGSGGELRVLPGSTLDVTGYLFAGYNLPDGATAKYIQSGGTVTVGTQSGVGIDWPGSTQFFSISGGSFTSGDTFYFACYNDATLEVVGGNAAMTLNGGFNTSYTPEAIGTLVAEVNASGLTTIAVTGEATFDDIFTVVDDGAAVGTYTLMTYDSKAGSFTTVNLPSGDWSYNLGDTSLTVTKVPEPATMALLGIGGIGVLIRRRRK